MSLSSRRTASGLDPDKTACASPTVKQNCSAPLKCASNSADRVEVVL